MVKNTDRAIYNFIFQSINYRYCIVIFILIMSSAQPRINKLPLLNTLVHVQLQNRMQEEQEMWRKHKRLKRKSSCRDSDESKHRKHKRKKKHSKKKKYQLRLKQNASACSPRISSGTVASSERWGHDGFMELHPDQVISGQCFDSSSFSKRKKSQFTSGQNISACGTAASSERWGHDGFMELHSDEVISGKCFYSSSSSSDNLTDRKPVRTIKKKSKKRKVYSDSSSDDGITVKKKSKKMKKHKSASRKRKRKS